MSLEDRMKDIDKRLEERLRRSEDRLASRFGEERSETAATSSQPQQKNSSALPTIKSSQLKMEELPPEDVIQFFEPRVAELVQSMAFVQHSPHVLENQFYRERAGSISFYYLDGSSEVNAYASDHPHQLPNGAHAKAPMIVFHAGLARSICVAATVLAILHVVRREDQYVKPFEDVRNIFREIGRLSAGSDFVAKEAKGFIVTILSLLNEANYTIPKSSLEHVRSLRSAMYMYVLGHELGHIAYGHTMGPNSSHETSRRKEYDADSFAYQVLHESPFSEYTFIGQVMVTLIFAWMGDSVGNPEATTHPLAAERFRDLMKDSSSRSVSLVEEQFGLSKELLESLLPTV